MEDSPHLSQLSEQENQFSPPFPCILLQIPQSGQILLIYFSSDCNHFNIHFIFQYFCLLPLIGIAFFSVHDFVILSGIVITIIVGIPYLYILDGGVAKSLLRSFFDLILFHPLCQLDPWSQTLGAAMRLLCCKTVINR